MLQTIDPEIYDVVAIQEPAFDRLGQTFAGLSWRVIYPEKHNTTPKDMQAVILINRAIPTDSHTKIKIKSQDVVGVRIKTEGGEVKIYNIYLDGSHLQALQGVEEAMRRGRVGAEEEEGEGRESRGVESRKWHRMCLGDFNCHHPL